jgi:glutaconate CoA-transferase subunit A
MDKICTLHEAIARDVQDGMTIAMGCALESLIPFAASHEMIRQNRKNLALVAPISDMQFDQLIGAGCVRKIIASWVGNVAAGLGHNYRRAAESGIPHPLEIEEHSNFTIGLGLQAGAMGVPFLPTRTIHGSDFAAGEPFKQVHCPFTGKPLIAVGAIRPDVTILHVQRADAEGNAHVWGNFGVMREAAMAARKVIITCEELVDHEVILSDPNRTVIPGSVVSSVVAQRWGAFPSPTQGYSRRDDDFYFEYHRATRTREGFKRWLQEWVLGVADHRAFLKHLGNDRIENLKPKTEVFAAPASFSY